MSLFKKLFNKQKVSVFFSACKHSDEAQVFLMLKDHQELAFIKDKKGVSPLFYAVANGNYKIAEALLRVTKQPNDVEPEKGFTPLLLAATNGNIGLVRLLLEYGAGPNMKNFDGITALHNAVFESYFDVAKLLLELGADPYIKDHNGNSPADLALKGDNRQIRALFFTEGDDNYTLSLGKKTKNLNLKDFAKSLVLIAADFPNIKKELEFSGLPADVQTHLRDEVFYLKVFAIEYTLSHELTENDKNQLMEYFYIGLFAAMEYIENNTNSQVNIKEIVKEGLRRSLSKYEEVAMHSSPDDYVSYNIGLAFASLNGYNHNDNISKLGSEIFLNTVDSVWDLLDE